MLRTFNELSIASKRFGRDDYTGSGTLRYSWYTTKATSASVHITTFRRAAALGRYRINSGRTAPSGLTGSAAFDPCATSAVEFVGMPKTGPVQ